jgi:hypothetical protein
MNSSTLRIYGADLNEFSRLLTRVARALPTEEGNRLWDIWTSYFGWYGLEGAYKRLNDRTVEQIFSEYVDIGKPPIESGKADGVSFRLYTEPRSEDRLD